MKSAIQIFPLRSPDPNGCAFWFVSWNAGALPYAGMLRLAEVTGDARYRDYVNERVTAIGTLAAHAKKNLPAGIGHVGRRGGELVNSDAMRRTQPHSQRLDRTASVGEPAALSGP